MNSDVQKSVNAKTHYFDEYLIVPDSSRLLQLTRAVSLS